MTQHIDIDAEIAEFERNEKKGHLAAANGFFVSALIARLKKAEAASQWMPIETAPKDGTNVIVCVAGLHRSTGEAYWWQNETGKGGWQTWDGENHRRTVYSPPPTHWMPLPSAPSDSNPKEPEHEARKCDVCDAAGSKIIGGASMCDFHVQEFMECLAIKYGPGSVEGAKR